MSSKRLFSKILLASSFFLSLCSCKSSDEGRVQEHYVPPSKPADGSAVDAKELMAPAPAAKEDQVAGDKKSTFHFSNSCMDQNNQEIAQTDARYQECVRNNSYTQPIGKSKNLNQSDPAKNPTPR